MAFPSFDNYANFAATTVATAPSPATTGTSLVVASGAGASLSGGGVPFNAVVWPAGAQPTDTNAEIVRVTAVSTDTLTITRNSLVGTFLITTTANSNTVTLANGTATVPASGTFMLNGQNFQPDTMLTVTSTTTGTLSQVAIGAQSAVATRIGVNEPGGINRSIVTGDNIAGSITLKALYDIQSTMHSGTYLAASISTSTTTVISTGLSFDIGASQVVTFDGELQVVSSATNTTGVKFALNAPTGATGIWSVIGPARGGAAGALSAISQGALTTLTTGSTIGPFNTTTAPATVFIQGNIINGATAGIVTIYYGSSATTGTVTCSAGSNLLSFRIA